MLPYLVNDVSKDIYIYILYSFSIFSYLVLSLVESGLTNTRLLTSFAFMVTPCSIAIYHGNIKTCYYLLKRKLAWKSPTLQIVLLVIIHAICQLLIQYYILYQFMYFNTSSPLHNETKKMLRPTFTRRGRNYHRLYHSAIICIYILNNSMYLYINYFKLTCQICTNPLSIVCIVVITWGNHLCFSKYPFFYCKSLKAMKINNNCLI